jgi:hypothetical protein
VHIACVDFPTPFGDGTCDRGLVSLGGLGRLFHFILVSIVSLGGLGRPFHFILSGDGRKSPVPTTKPSSDGILGAPLAAASFLLRAVPTTNSSSGGIVGAPLAVALFRLRAVRDTNSSLNSFVGAPFYVA